MKKALRTFLVILSVGGSDAGNITPGQALAGGMLAMAGCIGCAWGAERLGEKQHE